MDFTKDFAEKLETSRFLSECRRIEKLCRDFSANVDEIFRGGVAAYGGIGGVSAEVDTQRYTCRLGEFRPVVDFHASFLRVALEGKQVCIALSRPAEEEPLVNYIVGTAGAKPVDPDDSIYIRGRSQKEIPAGEFSPQTFDAAEFHSLLIKELIEEL